MKVKRVNGAEDLSLPMYATDGASGMDIVANVKEDIVLKPGERKLIPTGFSFQLKSGQELQVRPRSGLALKHGITVLNAPGTIDSDYRGEVGVILINLGQEDFLAYFRWSFLESLFGSFTFWGGRACLFSARKT